MVLRPCQVSAAHVIFVILRTSTRTNRTRVLFSNASLKVISCPDISGMIHTVVTWSPVVLLENTVPFSPDPSALRSILLNEGVKVRDPDGATPRVSTCPSGRGTSIYSVSRLWQFCFICITRCFIFSWENFSLLLCFSGSESTYKKASDTHSSSDWRTCR